MTKRPRRGVDRIAGRTLLGLERAFSQPNPESGQGSADFVVSEPSQRASEIGTKARASRPKGFWDRLQDRPGEAMARGNAGVRLTCRVDNTHLPQ